MQIIIGDVKIICFKISKDIAVLEYENAKILSSLRSLAYSKIFFISVMSIIAPYHKLLKETALIVCMQMYLES